MNKSTLLLSFAAAAFLAGCRVYLPGETPRRTVFGSGSTSSSAVPAARTTSPSPSPSTSLPGAEDDLLSPQPVAVPAPAPAQAPAPAPAPAPALPQTAGADSYRNYMGGGSGAGAPPRGRTALPAAAPLQPAPAAIVSSATPSLSEGSYRMYTVQPGDSAGMIANANGMTLAEFAKLNGLSDPNRIRVGQTVKIATVRSAPAAGPISRVAPPPQQAAPVSAPAGCVAVQAGDSLSAIASRNGTTTKALQEANGLSDPNKLRVGQILKLPGAATAAPVADPHAAQNAVHPIPPTTTRPVATIPTTTRPVATIPTTTRTPARVTVDEATAAPGGTVQAGDATFDVDAALSGGGLGAARQRAQNAVQAVQDVAQRAANGVQDTARSASDQLDSAAGQVASGVRSAVAPGTKEYVVQEGDDIYSIAMQFESQPLKIRALNGGVTLDDLKPGTRILVPAN
jgi:LysM repeat protein